MKKIMLDTPGEFIENRRLYSALLVTANQCDIVGMVQDVTSTSTMYPPGFSSIFPRPVIGIISKMDLEEDASRAESFLQRAGAQTIIKTSAVNRQGIDKLRAILRSE
ncbi:MAG: ethanolamine utilization protein EutP [Acidobacteria bacterium]|nr:MAG: ethanolamine utilization protein EutP [Acidobacteriota bacterium]